MIIHSYTNIHIILHSYTNIHTLHSYTPYLGTPQLGLAVCEGAVLSVRAALVLGIVVAESGLVVVEHELLSLGASAGHG